MLLLAGIEWVFFRVIRMGLWFGFVLRRVLIVQGIFLVIAEQGLHGAKTFSVPHSTPSVSGL